MAGVAKTLALAGGTLLLWKGVRTVQQYKVRAVVVAPLSVQCADLCELLSVTTLNGAREDVDW